MSQPPIARSLLWIAACGQLLCTLSPTAAFAESRSVVPMVVDDMAVDDADEKPVRKVNKDARDAKATKATRVAMNDKNNKRLGKPAVKPSAGRDTRRSERQPDATYRRIRDGWHAPIAAVPVAELNGERPPLVLSPVNAGGELVSVTPDRDDGGFSPEAQRLAARALAPVQKMAPHPIAPHLLDLVYRAMRHFNAPLVHVISGYRKDRAGSRHTQGRAIDMVLPGVSNEELAAYVRQFGFVGVGVYPKSGFVHLDVRDTSFFWVDYSLPDERCKTQQILPEESKRADEMARSRGEQPDFFVPNNEREDKAAARAYKRRAQQRHAKPGMTARTSVVR